MPRGAAAQQAAIEAWLLSAHPNPSTARQEWDRGDVALLPLGTQFSAIRIPREVVLSAIRLEEAHDGTLNKFLAQMLWDGPVISDQHGRRYYALVPPDTALVWHKEASGWNRLGVEILDRDLQLGVPRPALDNRMRTSGSSYWAVPMTRPDELCEPIAVAHLVSVAVRMHTPSTDNAQS
ncbi:hypothetical protein ABTZ58_03595 [Streptomyces sp. NPDC094143]